MFTYTHISIILSIFLINRLLLNFVNYCSYPYGYFYMLCKSSILCLHLQGRRIMIPITIISGFLGAGKTTYLQHILNCRNTNERILIIENDFGETSLDAKQLSASGATVREVTSGCICCSLQGNFKNALIDILSTQDIDQIYIEPSGVSKLSEILYTCDDDDITSKAYISMIITIVDAMQAPMAIKNFGPFFKDQIKHCYAILLTHIEDEKQVEKAKQLIVELAPHTPIYTDVDALQQGIHQLKSNTHKAHEHDSETCSCHTCNDSEDYNGAHHNNHSHHSHDGHHHEHQPFVSYTFHNLQTLTHTQWIDFCNKLPSTVLRVKGIVPTSSGPMELQYTLQSCSLTDTHLKDYHLVVIGTDIDISSIQEKVCSAS